MAENILISKCVQCGLCVNKIELFEDFTNEEQLMLMKNASHMEVSRGEIIIFPDDKVDKFYIVLNGKLKLSNYDDQGKEYIYDIVTSGKTIGEDLLFSDKKFDMYGEAISKLHICMLTKESLESFIGKNPEFAMKFIRSLGKKSTENRQKAELLSVSDSKKRIAKFLIFRSKEIQADEIELSRENISSAINITRETVSRKLNELAKEGLIELEGYKKIKLINKEKLKTL